MGIGNVTEIQTTWGHLPDQAHRLAVYMGRVATDKEREFYGGRELLAIGLGRPVPTEPDDDDDSDDAREARKLRKATFEAVRRCMRYLESVGFIEQTRAPARKQTTRYKLNPSFNGPDEPWPVTGQTNRGPSKGSTGQTHRAQRARPTVPTGQTNRADGPDEPWPKEEEDVGEDLAEDASRSVGDQPQDRVREAGDGDSSAARDEFRAARAQARKRAAS